MILKLIETLKRAGIDVSPEGIADLLWLASYLDKPDESEKRVARKEPEIEIEPELDTSNQVENIYDKEEREEVKELPHEQEDIKKDVYLSGHKKKDSNVTGKSGIILPMPSTFALPGRLEISRHLRPLKRKVSSRIHFELDEEATVKRMAEQWLANKSHNKSSNIPMPVLRPTLTRWLELFIIIDDAPSMVIWEQTVNEFKNLLEEQGAFKNIHLLGLNSRSLNKRERLYVRDKMSLSKTFHQPEELIDPRGERLFLIISDCVSLQWYRADIKEMLMTWGEKGLVTIVQVLPHRLWKRTALGKATSVSLTSYLPGTPNVKLKFEVPWYISMRNESPSGLPVPVITLEPETVGPWARFVAGTESMGIQGYLMQSLPTDKNIPLTKPLTKENTLLPDSDLLNVRIKSFLSTASPEARKLAAYLAAVPLNMPVIRIIQQEMLPKSRQVHLAEVFLSGLIKQKTAYDPFMHYDDIQYEFIDGARDYLIGTSRISETVDVMSEVFDKITKFIDRETGKSINFQSFIEATASTDKIIIEEGSKPFAQVSSQVLRRLGGHYASLAKNFEDAIAPSPIAMKSKAKVNELENIKDVNLENNPIQTPDVWHMQCPACHSEIQNDEKGCSCGWVKTEDGDQTKGDDNMSQRDDKAEKTESENVSNHHDIHESNSNRDHSSSNPGMGNLFHAGGDMNLFINRFKKEKTGFQEGLYEEMFRFKKEKTEELFDDPTNTLPPKPAGLLEYKEDDLEKYVKSLKSEQLLIIRCIDKNISLSVAYSLIGKTNLPNMDKRLLSFEGENSERSDLTINLFAGRKADSKTLIIAEAFNSRAQIFLNSLFTGPLATQTIKDRLKSTDIWFICLVKEDIFSNTIKERKAESFFKQWKVDFLLPLLRYHYPDRADDLNKVIRKQYNNKLWGDSEISFYELITAFMGSGLLLDEVEKRENFNKEQGDSSDFLKEIDNVQVESLFHDNEQIEKVVLYLATYFRALSPYEFNMIVSLLLGDQTITINKLKRITNQEDNTSTDQHEEIIKLKDIWESSGDKILKKCFLRAIKQVDATKVIEFTSPFIRHQLKDYLEREYTIFLEKQFQQIQYLGLLFHSSERVTQNVIDLVIDMALSDPEHYGKDWLIILVIGFIQQFKLEISGNNDWEQLTNLLIQIEVENEKRRHFFKRISMLIMEMLRYEKLEAIVDNFFRHLMSNDLQLIVLEINNRLSTVPLFQFKWMKVLFDKGTEDIREMNYNTLYNKMAGMSSDDTGKSIYDFLQRISGWLPEPHRSLDFYSPANIVALSIFMDYCLNTTSGFDFNKYGKWPSLHPLFRSINIDNDSHKIEILCNWLFHPGMKHLYREEFNTLMAFLISEWFIIHHDAEKSVINKEASNMLDQLLFQIVLVADLSQQRELINSWTKMRYLLTKHLNSSNIPDPTEKKHTDNRYNLIWSLRKKFKQQRQKTKSTRNSR